MQKKPCCCTLILVALFYGIGMVYPWAFLADKASAVDIATIHTGFNIAATAVMMPLKAGELHESAAYAERFARYKAQYAFPEENANESGYPLPHRETGAADFCSGK